ncbi:MULTISPECIES: hypothetical protein [unclassified Bradyrhizobium]|uniref:hypothetical protein n=1 Tax=unclassified Bradyrhizobium TaxID=2631580 RepID=UPI0028F1487B|nr:MULTISPECIES: hypothetical protein [unclassified Bradyrhizobium]
MLREAPGVLRMNPARSSVSIIWCTVGGVTHAKAAETQQQPKEGGRSIRSLLDDDTAIRKITEVEPKRSDGREGTRRRVSIAAAA